MSCAQRIQDMVQDTEHRLAGVRAFIREFYRRRCAEAALRGGVAECFVCGGASLFPPHDLPVCYCCGRPVNPEE